jgi:gamma-D-glutamyl-L-lysine dipeptidyl-peptidase
MFAARRLLLCFAMFCAACQPGLVTAEEPIVPVPVSSSTNNLPQVEEASPSETPSPVPTAMRLPTPTLLLLTAIPTQKPIVTSLPFPPATVQVELADVWDDPTYEGGWWHRQTQLIMGEPVLVVGRRGEWSQVIAIEQPSHKHPLGYPGWVRSRALTSGWVESGLWLVVMAPYANLYGQPLESAPLMARASLDTRLPILIDTGVWLAARLPDGRTAWVQRDKIRLTGDLNKPDQLEGLLAASMTLPHTVYLWGGASTTAFDCSGLVYRLFHAHGLRLPRDAEDQKAAGLAIAGEAPQPGDLLFFSNTPGGPVTHVAIQLENGMMLDDAAGVGLSVRPLSEVLENHAYVTAESVIP